MRNETSAWIAEAAAGWAARIDRSPLDPEEQARLDVWLAEDTRHLGAFMRARAALIRFDSLDALDCRPLPKRRRWPAISRRGVMAAGAGLLAASVAAVLLWPGPVSYRTGVGEVRMIPLEDGSVATLNTQSEMQVRYDGDRRLVTLVRGEGYFEVAKDVGRPFIVATGDAQVRAVGTAFTVRSLPDHRVEVRVREGVVDLRATAADGAAVRLDTNMHALVGSDGRRAIHTDRVSAAEIERDLLWREGRLSFERSTLESAVRELNRYNSIRIVLADPAIGKRRLTGLFSANDPHGFAQAVAMTMDLGVKTEGGRIVLSQQSGDMGVVASPTQL